MSAKSVLTVLILVFLTPNPAIGQSTSDFLASADRQFRQGKFDDAVSTYRKLLTESSVNIAAHQGLIRALLEQDKVREAEQAVQAALVQAPHDAVLLALQGDLLFRQGEFEKSRFSYFAALQENKNLARGYWGAGRILETERRLKSAKQLFEKAYELDPRDPDIILSWSSTLPKASDRIAALESYITLATFKPKWMIEDCRNGIELLKILGDEKIFVPPVPLTKVRVNMELLQPNPKQPPEGVGIKIALNGGKPQTLIVDTRAGLIYISKRLAERSGVKRLSTVEFSGFGDEKAPEIYYAKVDSIRVGKLELRNCIVEVIDAKYLGGRDGIISPRIFSNFLVRMDYPNGVLELEPLPKRTAEEGKDDAWFFDRTIAPEMTGFVPFRTIGPYILLETRVNSNQKKWFVLDSGSPRNLLSAAVTGRVTEDPNDPAVVLQRLSGWGGSLNSPVQVMLEFAGLRQTNVDTHSIDFQFNKLIGTEISGVLAHPTLQHLVLILDYRNGLLKMTYQP